ncbi:hypothetical protein E2C01_046615 [Portunus trituberculatus]|uniref:Uncharacterized protein n=1 Tax=Portunus trituberculatus TaxID=210409 RepID=A0A5B7G5A0_PORTR|nr:hypothetical protein [Portunus trituberculatus]
MQTSEKQRTRPLFLTVRTFDVTCLQNEHLKVGRTDVISDFFVFEGRGMAGLAACAGCLLATPNSPRPLGESGSVFTLSGVNTHQPVTPRPSAPESVPNQPENNGTVPPPSSTVLPTPTKVIPQGNGYSHSPIFPRNPNYPAEPPPSYSAPSYPAGGQPGRRLARTMPPNVTRAVSSPPTLHTVADLPPPYAPGHSQSLRQ